MSIRQTTYYEFGDIRYLSNSRKKYAQQPATEELCERMTEDGRAKRVRYDIPESEFDFSIRSTQPNSKPFDTIRQSTLINTHAHGRQILRRVRGVQFVSNPPPVPFHAHEMRVPRLVPPPRAAAAAASTARVTPVFSLRLVFAPAPASSAPPSATTAAAAAAPLVFPSLAAPSRRTSAACRSC